MIPPKKSQTFKIKQKNYFNFFQKNFTNLHKSINLRKSQADERMDGYNYEKEYKNSDFGYDRNKPVKRKRYKDKDVYEGLLKSGVFKNPNNKRKFEIKEYEDISSNPQKPAHFEFNTPSLPLPSNYKPKKPISNPLSHVNYLPIKVEDFEKFKNEQNSNIQNNNFALRKEQEPRPLSNPMYLRDLSSSIHSMNRDRYYKNEGSKESFKRRAGRMRDEYEFEDRDEVVADNPYGRGALVKHKIGGLNNAEFGFDEVRDQRREYGREFDDLLASKLHQNKYNNVFISPFN